MKYLMLIYSNPEAWGHPTFMHVAAAEAERDELYRQFETLMTEIRDSGELVSVTALADPLLTRTVRVRDGLPVATDGPYIEAKEQMAGVFIVDCASPERAEEIASRFPEARYFAVELRPVMGASGAEM
jgi:hypothetical protein